MSLSERLLTYTISLVLRLLCKVDGDKFDSIPQQGPLLLVINHINFLDVPLIYTRLLPRNVRGIAKKETWDNWFFKILANSWDAIPIDREKPNQSTFREIKKTINDKKMLCIAPEGTRSGTGALGEGHQGVAYIALQNHIPLVIIAHYGAEKFWQNIKSFRRTKITFAVSPPFMLVNDAKTNKEFQREMTNQIMVRLAAMLPEKYRGAYKDLNVISDQYIQYLPPTETPK